MKKKRKVLLIVGLVLGIMCICVAAAASLSSSDDEDNTGKSGGNATAINDSTITVTSGPSATWTSTSTPENTATPTMTLPPATATALVVEMTKTAEAESKNATATEVARIATATRNAYEGKLTATSRAIVQQKTLVASYEEIYWKELITYPDNYIGEKVVVRGRIFNINGDTELQMYLAGTYEAVYIVMDKSFSNIYENDSITVYGVIDGTHCGTNAFGGKICQPLIVDAWFTKP